jgi:ABC-type Na+ efflux pump permease subunit
LQPELQFQVMKDVSLGAMSVFTWLLAVLATAMLLPKDIEDRTLYTILAKPVPRLEYLLGKLLGVLAMLAISLAVMAILFAATLYVKEQVTIAGALAQVQQGSPDQTAEIVRDIKALTFTWSLVPGIVLIYFKAAIFAALTLLISTFATSWIFTIVISVAAYLIGHLVPIARTYLLENGGAWATKGFLMLITLLFPDLQLFNLSDDIVAGNAVPMHLFLQTAGIGCFYLTVYACLAYLMFAKKEL